MLYVDLGADAVVKNETLKRMLPLAGLVIELGFERYVAALEKAGKSRLFPKLRPNKFDKRCQAASRVANRMIDKVVTEDPRVTSRNLRHNAPRWRRSETMRIINFFDRAVRGRIRDQLRRPVVAAPMFLVSRPDLVINACRAGIVGSFPTLDARTPEILDQRPSRIADKTVGHAPHAANLLLHQRNNRRDVDLDLIVCQKVPWIIASVGSSDQVAKAVPGYGGLVFADVATTRQARKAVDAGVDG